MEATDDDLKDILRSAQVAHPRYEIMTERDKEVALSAMRRTYELGRLHAAEIIAPCLD